MIDLHVVLTYRPIPRWTSPVDLFATSLSQMDTASWVAKVLHTFVNDRERAGTSGPFAHFPGTPLLKTNAGESISVGLACIPAQTRI